MPKNIAVELQITKMRRNYIDISHIIHHDSKYRAMGSGDDDYDDVNIMPSSSRYQRLYFICNC
jgi:hypothetical protein